jgi:site-specific DNA recombinase
MSTTAREYLRVSRDKSGRERSPEEQHRDHLDAAGERGVTLGRPYRDVGSASKYAAKVRAGYDKLIADLTAGKFGAQQLWLWEGSRGSRKTAEWVNLLELLETNGVQVYIHTYARLFDPRNPYDRADLLQLAIKSELDSAQTSQRAKRAQKNTAAEGKPNGRVPFGYVRRYDPVTRKFASQDENPDEAKVIRELFDRLHKGESLRSIAADFERRGIRSGNGTVFSAKHLRVMALNHAYVGLRVHDPARPRKGKGCGKLSTSATFTKAVWPALVSEKLFWDVYNRLTAKERATTRPGRGVHLLSMIVGCAECDGPLAARTDERGNAVYTCHRKGCVRVSKVELDELAERLIIEVLSSKEVYGRWAHRGNDADLDHVRGELAKVRAELEQAQHAVPATVGEARMFGALVDRLAGQVRELEERERTMAVPAAVVAIKPGKDVARRWKAAPMSARRELVRLFLGDLRVRRQVERGVRVPVEERVTFAGVGVI